MISDYFNIGLKNLRRRRLRSWLTILGIVIAIATIFVLISVSVGLQQAVSEQFRILGTDKFFILPRGQIAGPGTGGAVSFTIDDVNTVDKVPGVKDLSYWTGASAQVKYRDQIRYTFVVGVPLDRSDLFLESGAYKSDEGSLFRKNDEGKVMIGSQYKYNNFFSRPVSVNDKLIINGQQFEVKTILKTIGNPQDDRIILMPLSDFKDLFNQTDRIDQIVVQVDREDDINEIVDRTRKRLLNTRGLTEKTRDFIILTPEELLSSFGTVLNIITGFLIGIAAISLLVGGIGIANTMFTSVLERTREIGIMKSVGAQNKDILLIFLIESGLLGLVGGIIGVLLGISISKGIEYIAVTQLATTLLRAAIPFYLIIGCLAFSFLIGAISGIWPAWRATKIKPVEALRYE